MIKFFLGIVFVCLVGFSVKQINSDKANATVNQVQGVYLFVDSKPLAEYDYLGTVDTKGMTSGNPQYTVIRDKLIKRLKKDYPQADGIVFNFNAGGRDHADAIKFK